MDGGAWQAGVYGIARSRTWLSDFTFTFTFHFHALEKEMATHSSVLAWRIPGTGEPGGLPSMGSRRIGHDWSDLAAAEVHQSELDSILCTGLYGEENVKKSGYMYNRLNLLYTWNSHNIVNQLYLNKKRFLKSVLFPKMFHFSFSWNSSLKRIRV